MNNYSFPELPREEQLAILLKTASQLGIRVDMVEKDFWVCWCLQRIFAVPELRRACLFKGGTSLSKVTSVP